MPLKYFSQLDGLSMPASIIILDIDGTIVFDGSDEITPDVLANIKKFNSVSRVYLSSNNKMTDRNNKLSELSEVPYIRTKLRKPNPKAVRDINIGCGHVAVIGDKFLTDGLLAIFIGAEFIKVRRLTSNNDSRLARFLCFCDDSAFNIFLMLKLMRVKHWSKNILVFSSLFFAREIFDLDKIALVFLAWLGFSLTASSIYIINDIFDRKNDSLHPVKKYRPIANGDISVPAGACMAMILLIFGLLLGFMSGVYVSILLLFYFF